jgi:hypothetical protein
LAADTAVSLHARWEAVRRHPRTPALSMAAVALAAFALVMVLGRRIGFYFDEWNFLLDRRGHALHVFLDPHNEHLVLAPVVIYKVLAAVLGVGHHWPYLAVLALMHVALGTGVFLLARPRVGPWLALALATLILFEGLAYQNIIWAFQISFVGSVLGGVWAWVGLDRPGRRGDVLACAALVFATASSSLGIPMVVGVGAELLAARRRRALWVPAVPLALYVLWYLGYGVSDITAEGVLHAAPWAMSAVAAAAGALVGLGSSWGAALAVSLVIALAWRLNLGPPTPRLVGVLVAGVAFWGLTGAGRSVIQPVVPPESSRYLTFGAVIVALVAVEVAVGIVASPRGLALAAAIALIAVALGLPALRDQAKALRTTTSVTYAALGAMKLVQAQTPPEYAPDPTNAPQITAGRYFSAMRQYGSDPADSAAELETGGTAERQTADRVLQEVAARLTPVPTPRAGAAPHVEQMGGLRVRQSGPCDVATPAGASPAVMTAIVPKEGVAVRALGGRPVQVRIRRFADGFDNGLIGTVATTRPRGLRLPADASPHPYRVQLIGSGRFALCVA